MGGWFVVVPVPVLPVVPVPVAVPVPVLVPVVVPVVPVPGSVPGGHVATEGSQFEGLGEPVVLAL
ncbi:MAG: hypothetical protein ABI889_07225 [Gemmatimonadota bacterium]